MLSEEPLEANHQFVLDDHLKHARETSRKDRISDVFHRDMDRSDPVILLYSIECRLKNREKQKHPIPDRILALVQAPEGSLDDDLNDV